MARGPESVRSAFHRPYTFAINSANVEMIDVITERRRVVLLAEARMAGGDHLFAHGTRAAIEALRPFRGRVSVIARLRFHPQNAYVMAPPIDVSMGGSAGEVARLDFRSESLLGLASGTPGERLPVVGAVAEAVFNASSVGQASRAVIVRLDGAELTRVKVDFSRLD